MNTSASGIFKLMGYVVTLMVPTLLGVSQEAGIPSSGPAQPVTASTVPRQKMVAVGTIKMDETAGVSGSMNTRVLGNLRKNLITDFVKTRKFAVLDREFGDQISAEKHSGEADRSEAGRTVKLGEEATADYVVSVAVKHFANAVSEQEMRTSGRKISKFKYDFSVVLQVIDVASRRVVFADTFDDSASGVVQASTPAFDLWAEKAASGISSRGCNAVLELVYPLKVVSITEGGDVIINEGSGRVATGESFEVYALGKALTDPDTGVEIGREETLKATIIVTRVLPKASYARIESPADASFPIGSICRKVKPQKPASTELQDASAPPAKPKKIKVDDDL